MSNKHLLFLFFTILISFSSFAQDNTVSATVPDATSKGGAGATVIVKGNQRAAITGDNGNFSMKANNGKTIIIGSVRFQTRSFVVNGSTLNDSLISQTKDLNEIVVTALDISKSKKELTYPVLIVKGIQKINHLQVSGTDSLHCRKNYPASNMTGWLPGRPHFIKPVTVWYFPRTYLKKNGNSVLCI